MVHTSGMCTVRFGSYGAYEWHVYRKVWIVWCIQVACMCTCTRKYERSHIQADCVQIIHAAWMQSAYISRTYSTRIAYYCTALVLRMWPNIKVQHTCLTTLDMHITNVHVCSVYIAFMRSTHFTFL